MAKIREIRIAGDIAFIPLTKGYEAIIDAEDVPLIKSYNWGATVGWSTVYALAKVLVSPKKRRTLQLHHMILKTQPGYEVDHIDGNGLNNRRSNLRPATRAEQNRNVKRSVRNESGFKGVKLHKESKKWMARITLNKKTHYLGLHSTPELAHAAYCQAAIKYHGEFARFG